MTVVCKIWQNIFPSHEPHYWFMRSQSSFAADVTKITQKTRQKGPAWYRPTPAPGYLNYVCLYGRGGRCVWGSSLWWGLSPAVSIEQPAANYWQNPPAIHRLLSPRPRPTTTLRLNLSQKAFSNHSLFTTCLSLYINVICNMCIWADHEEKIK